MDTAHWSHQEIGLVKPMEELIPSSAAAFGGNNIMARPPQQMMGGGGGGGERRVRPQKEQALNCPRCNSTNTKFCYYNNYSLTQPRYFCKTCRRYWTEGGSLRSVPVGGGSRKNKRSSSSSSSASTSAANASSSASANASTSLPTLSSSVSSSSSKNPKFQEGQDLNLAFPALPEFGACTNAATTTASNLSAMELLRSTGMQQGVRGPLNPFMPMHPMSIPEYPSGFGVQDFRANSLSFPLDGGGYGAGMQEGGAGRLLFPFEASREPVSSNAGGGAADHQFDKNNKGEPPGFWNGMMGSGGGGGGGGSW